MTADISPNAVQHLTADNGAPASGYKLFTYAAGTSATKLESFTDASGDTPNTNPIILNSRGECGLWLAAGLGYKIVFADRNDSDPPTNPIWTVDQIYGQSNSGVSQWISLYNQTSTVTINRNNLDIHFNASAGPINQTLPSIAILSLIFPTLRIRFWKDDSSANAVNISTSDGYNGFTSPLSLSLQGASLELDINTNLVKWDVI